jgi:hypothetical protein
MNRSIFEKIAPIRRIDADFAATASAVLLVDVDHSPSLPTAFDKG